MRKLTSVLLVLLLVVSMCCIAATNVGASGAADLPEPAEGMYRYYFLAPNQWLETNDVAGIYWWTPSENGAWPGEEATRVGDYKNLFYYDVPKETPVIIWNAFVDAGTKDNPTEDAPYAFQTANVSVEYLDPGENDKWPEGRDDMNGCIYVIDCNGAPDFDPFGGATTWPGEWCDFDPETTKIDGDLTAEEYVAQKYFDVTQPTQPSETDPSSDSSDPTDEPTSEPATSTQPVTSDPTEPSSESTQPTTAPAESMTINGVKVKTGDQVTYTAYLKAEELAAGINAYVEYDGSLLKVSDETKALKKKDVIPTAYTGSSILNFDPVDGASQVLFNSNDIDEGYDFTADGTVLITLKFDVIGTSGDGKIETKVLEFLGMTDDDNKNLPIDYVLTDMTEGPKHTYNVAGEKTLTGFEWNAAENPMTQGEDGVWTLTFKDIPAGTYSYKICEDGKFDVTYNDKGLCSESNNNNVVFTTDDVCDITIFFDGNKTWAEGDHIIIVTDHTYTIAGNADLCGSSWDPADANNDMTKISEGVYQKVYTNVDAGQYDFKVAQDHSWGISWGDPTTESGNAFVNVDEDNSTVTITFTVETGAIVVDVTPGSSEPQPTEPSSDVTEPTGTEPTEPTGAEPTEPTGTEPTEPSTGSEPTDAPTDAPTSAPTSAPTDAPTNGGTPGGSNGKVPTGDSTSVTLLLSILMLAAGAVVLARKKVKG